MLVSSKVEKITKEKANEYLKFNEGNRPLRKWQVAFLSGEMKKKRFSPTATIAMAVNGATPRLVNGQHTLSAIAACGIPQSLSVVEHKVEGTEALAQLFAHYDIGLKRTFSDAVNYYDVVGKLESSPTQINKLAAGLRHIGSGLGGTHLPNAQTGFSNEDVIQWVYNWYDSWMTFRETMHPCETWLRNRLESKSISSVALITLRFSESDAAPFWRQVSQDDGLRRGDPRHALHKKLLEISTLRAMSATGSHSILSTNVQSGMAAWAWNKYIRGMDMVSVRPPVSFRTGGIYVLDTPFAKPDCDPIYLLNKRNE